MPHWRRGKPEVPNAHEALWCLTVDQLRALARCVPGKPPAGKDNLVAFVEQAVKGPGLRRTWDELSEIERRAVSEVVHSPGLRLDMRRFAAKYGQGLQLPRMERYSDPRRINLIFLAGAMPPDVKEALRAFVPEPEPVRIRTQDSLPDSIVLTEKRWHPKREEEIRRDVPLDRRETEHAALRDVQAVLRLVEAGKIPASEKTKRASSAGVEAVTRILDGGDFYAGYERKDRSETDPGPMKAFAWPLIVQAAGLATLAGSKLALTVAGRRALGKPPDAILRDAWSRWLKTTVLDEFSRVEVVKGQGGSGTMTAVAGRREAIVAGLAECPAGRWIAFDEFSRYLQAAGHEFEVAREPYWLHVADSEHGHFGHTGFADWPILQGRYLLAFLFEYAATMGVIDVAYIPPARARPDFRRLYGTCDLDCLSRYDGLQFIRVNPLGTWILGVAGEVRPSATEPRPLVKVLPNLDVVATEGGLPAADALLLDVFAERVSDAVWALRMKKILEGVERGHPVAEIEEFLRSRGADPLPETVSALFRDIEERARRIEDLGPARLFGCSDRALARQIANDSAMRKLGVVAGEGHIALPLANEESFRRRLREMGYGVPPARGARAAGRGAQGDDE